MNLGIVDFDALLKNQNKVVKGLTPLKFNKTTCNLKDFSEGKIFALTYWKESYNTPSHGWRN